MPYRKKRARKEKGGVGVLPATDDKREIDEGFVMAQNVSKSAVAQPLSHAPAHNYSHLASLVREEQLRGRGRVFQLRRPGARAPKTKIRLVPDP